MISTIVPISTRIKIYPPNIIFIRNLPVSLKIAKHIKIFKNEINSSISDTI